MHFIILPRRGGKTTRLIQRLVDNPRAMLIEPLHQMRDMVAKDHPDIADRMLSFRQWINFGQHSKDCDEVLVDNLDLLLPEFLGVRHQSLVVSATGSLDPKKCYQYASTTKKTVLKWPMTK